jgi:hypothetical protein
MIKVLLLAANPLNTDRLRLDEEFRAIDQALQSANYRDKFDLNPHGAVRVSDLAGLLLRYQPHIVHFSSHGSAMGEIMLEDDRGKAQPVPSESLSRLFSVLKDNIRCVVLNACYSEKQALAIAQYIDYVIGMSRSISDNAAIDFATAFYQAVGYGRDLKTAFELGCINIGLDDLNEENTPRSIALHSDPSKIILALAKGKAKEVNSEEKARNKLPRQKASDRPAFQPPVQSFEGNYIGEIKASGHAKVNVSQKIIHQATPEMDRLFKRVKTEARAKPQKVQTQIKQIEREAARGEKTDPLKLENLLTTLAKMAPDILDVIIACLGGPVAGFTAVFKKIAIKAKESSQEKGL